MKSVGIKWPWRYSPDITITFTLEIDGIFFQVWWGKNKKVIHFFLHPLPKDQIHFYITYLLLFIYNLHCLSFLINFSLSHKKSQLNCRTTVERPTRRKDSSVITRGGWDCFTASSFWTEWEIFTHHQKGKHKKDLGHCLHFDSSLYWATADWTPTNCTLQVFLVLWCRSLYRAIN